MRFEFRRRHVADGLEQPAVVEPIHPRQRLEFHPLQMLPRTLPSNHLRLEEPNHRLGEGIVIRVAAAADRRRDPGVGEPVGVPHRQILRTPVAVMHQAADAIRATVAHRLFERIEHEVRPRGQIDILRGATEAHTSVMLDGSASDELRGTASEAGRHAMWYQMDISSSEGELAAELDRALGTGAVALSLAKGLRLDAGGERTLVDVVKRAPIPVLCDGVMSAEEARWAVQNGVAGVIVSNRTGPASRGSSVDALPKIRAALGDDIVILLGGGIRSGTDILKALALGANAVLIGRPVQWGLAAAGNAGVRKVLELLESELALSMALCGRPSVEAIGPSLVRRWATATR